MTPTSFSGPDGPASHQPKGRFRCLSFPALMALALALCLASIVLACSLGALGFRAKDVFSVLLSALPGVDAGLTGGVPLIGPGGEAGMADMQVVRNVVLTLRLPRVLLAFLAGSGLALAGAAFQAVLRNPLADPFTLGVSGGAAFGAALAISFGLTGTLWGLGLPLAAFAGAGAALFAVLMLGRLGGTLQRETLVLAGVVVSAFLAALIALVKALDEASVTGIVFWIMGSFQGRGLTDLFLFLPGFFLGAALLVCMPRELDMLSVGDRAARHMGLNTGLSRLILLLAAGALTASCVAVSGIIGFVGLIVPHLVRMLLGAAHARVLWASALFGGFLLLWSDTAARTLLPGGVELPVGVLTALLGGPFFCYILGKKQTVRSVPLVALRDTLPAAHAAPVCLEASANAGKTATPDSNLANICEPQIVCQKLGFTYFAAPRAALSDICCTLEQGDYVGLLGPNGSGKSTLLHCLSGLLPPSQGQALVAGLALAGLPEKRRARLVAALPQRPEFVPTLSAFALVLMGRYAHTSFWGNYNEKDKAIALAALAECGAAHLARRPASCLSGGELQRVLLARSLAQNAAVLLLDEATAGLDPACSDQVLSAISRRNRECGLTVLAAMHDVNLAARYCRRLIFLKAGRIVANGPVETVFTTQVLEAVYETRFSIVKHPVNGCPQALA